VDDCIILGTDMAIVDLVISVHLNDLKAVGVVGVVVVGVVGGVVIVYHK
jgi:hypothetical protein